VTPSFDPLEGREIIVEWASYGDVMRVAVIDAATGVEAAASGPVATPRFDLERLALRKLAQKFDSQNDNGATEAPPAAAPRRGRWV